MENRKTYHAPLAQIVLFAPSEKISSFFGAGKNNSWWDNSAWWGAKYAGQASVVTGGLGLEDEDSNTWNYDGKINNSN